MRRLATLVTALALACAAALAGAPGAAAVPGPAQYPQYWWDAWGVPGLWAAGDRGAGITVAVIDTGVQRIPELARALRTGTDLTGLGGNGQTDREIDAFSHGTAMASIIAARGSPATILGPAPDVAILPIAVPLQGVREKTESDRTAAAIDYATAHGANVINMSFGARQYRHGAADDPCPADTQAAILHALLRGVLVVASSGNDGESGSPVTDPSVCLGVISVAAVDAQHRVAPFSSRHHYVTVAAPGVGITSLNRQDQLYTGDGTSQASALTRAALALIWSAHPHETNRQIAARLVAGLTDVPPAGRDTSSGYGEVDPARSAAATITARSANPVFAAADPYLAELRRGAAALPVPAPVTPALPGTAQRGTEPADSAARRAVVGLGAGGAGLVVLLAALLRRRRPVPAPAQQYYPQQQWPPQ